MEFTQVSLSLAMGALFYVRPMQMIDHGSVVGGVFICCVYIGILASCVSGFHSKTQRMTMVGLFLIGAIIGRFMLANGYKPDIDIELIGVALLMRLNRLFRRPSPLYASTI